MNEKWFAPDISQIEKKLKTNAASGLSPRAARSRRTNSFGKFFIVPKRSAFSMILETVSDFALILLVISSVAALCFSEYATGIGLLVTVTVNLLATAFLSFRAQRLFEALESFYHPSVTVIRGGKAYSVDSESVVPGDVVLLTAGDVLSFDARLITSDKLKVLVRVDRETVTECEKHAERRVDDAEYDVRNMTNMVHAGSVIKEGSARAIVTAVGKYTYFGAMTGGVVLKTQNKMPRGLVLLKKYGSALCMALTVAILPFSLLSLLFSHDKVTLLTAFTSVLAIAAASASGIAFTSCRFFFERQARVCLSSKNPAVLRSPEVMDKLLAVEYLFLLDGGATSDGVLRFESAITVDGEIKANEPPSPSSVTLAELVSLYDAAESRTLTVGIHTPGRFSAALSEFVAKTRIDSEALKIRCSVTGYVPSNLTDSTDKLFYIDGNIRYILNVSSSAQSICGCNRTVRGDSVMPLGEDERQRLIETCSRCIRKGKQILVFTLSDNVAAQTDVKSIFGGALVLSQRSDAGFKKSVSELAARGVKTISFVNSSTSFGESRSVLSAPMLSEGVTENDFAESGKPVTYKFGTISTYVNFSDENIDALIAHIHSMGKKVAVVSFGDRYKSLKQRADLFVGLSALQHKFVGRFENEIESLDIPGSSESLSCRQDIKRDADLMVPRPSEGRGGLASVVMALSSVGRAYTGLLGFFKYLLCVQFARIAAILVPMFFGAAHLDARHALFCGLIIDLFVLLVFAFDKGREVNMRHGKRVEREFSKPLKSNAGMIAAAAASALCAVILPYLLSNIGFMGRYLCKTEYLFISLVLLHLAVMYCVRFAGDNKYNRKKKFRSNVNKAGVALSAFLVIFFAVCFLARRFGAIFGVFSITLPYLVLTVVPSAIFVLLFELIGGISVSGDE